MLFISQHLGFFKESSYLYLYFHVNYPNLTEIQSFIGKGVLGLIPSGLGQVPQGRGQSNVPFTGGEVFSTRKRVLLLWTISYGLMLY